jgi:hypothetical protein
MTGMRGYTSYPFHNFGKGLNLKAKPDAIDPAECVDCMNVIYTDTGAVEQRAGYDNLTASALTNRVESLEAFYQTSGTKQLLAGCGTRLEAISTAGEVVASATGLTNAVWDFARFGKPNAEVAYAGNGTDTLRKWSGTEWTAPTATVNGEAGKAMPKGAALAVWPAAENRLVATKFSTTTGGPSGKESSPSHVYFSDPGNPESWTAKEGEENYAQLSPGDGEAIQAVVAWKEFIVVFKETRFFVFYGQSTSSSGSPEFLFRVVDSGVGLASPRAVCAHPDGIYFMSRHGVYRTTGQEPEAISGPVEPIWTGAASPFYTGGVLAHASITNCAMTAYEDRIYLSYPTESANNRTLVYDPKLGWWSLTSIPASCLAVFRPSNTRELVFGYASGEKQIGRHSLSYTNDDGAAIESYWRSGWFDLENPDEKVLRSSKFWGTGKVSCGTSYDFREDVGALDLLTMEGLGETEWDKSEWSAGEWAIAPGLIEAWKRRATRGTVFSLYLYNNILNQDWSLHRATHHLREIARPEAVR